jgi:hypothetical protein
VVLIDEIRLDSVRQCQTVSDDLNENKQRLGFERRIGTEIVLDRVVGKCLGAMLLASPARVVRVHATCVLYYSRYQSIFGFAPYGGRTMRNANN